MLLSGAPEVGSDTEPVMWRADGRATLMPATFAESIEMVPAVPESAVKPVLPHRPDPYVPEVSLKPIV
jgi:hypothetical protein